MERMSQYPRPDPACWHYRDERGRACGPYDTGALARLYRFGHLRAESEVWCDADATPPAPLRNRRDVFRLHGDGRLEALPPAPAGPTAMPAAGVAAPASEARPACGDAPQAPALAPDAGPPMPEHRAATSSPAYARPRRTRVRAVLALLALALAALAIRLAS